MAMATDPSVSDDDDDADDDDDPASVFSSTISMALPFQTVNIVMVTDVHGWIGGHDSRGGHHEPYLDADYGDVASFYERIKRYLRRKASNGHEKQDVLLVMNGDSVDGTGLASSPRAQQLLFRHLLPLMPFDVVNLGNHEIYHAHTVEAMLSTGYIEHWNGR